MARALTAPNEDKLIFIRKGSSSIELDEILGLKEKTFIISQSERIDYYKYSGGKKFSLIRASMHGMMSVATMGGWEIAGLSIEDKIGEPVMLAVKLKNNKVEDIKIEEYN